MYTYILQISGIVLIFKEISLSETFFRITFTSFDCSNDNDDYYICNSAKHILFMVFSIIIGLIASFIIVFSILFFTDDNPFPKVIWNNNCFKLRIFKLIRKLMLTASLYIGTDSKLMGIWSSGLIFIFSLGILYVLVYELHLKQKYLLIIIMTFESFNTWVAFGTFLAFLTDCNMSHPIIILIVSIGLITLMILMNIQNENNILRNDDIISIKTVHELEEYCDLLLNVINDSKEVQKVFIDEKISFHSYSCKDPKCICHDFFSSNVDLKVNDDIKLDITIEKAGSEIASKGFNPDGINMAIEKKKDIIIKLIISELAKWNEIQDGKERIHIYIGYLKLKWVENIMASLYEEMCAEEIASGIYEEYHTFRLKYFIFNLGNE